ncbi:hypothetical protein [Mesorhizobium sp. WSM2239]|uniref:LysR substrate-binding domain-containing protein n=2 Tax=unclassified Mesorhizobium TaxID=325217 RepID=A0AAU8DHJ3_9HYPH
MLAINAPVPTPAGYFVVVRPNRTNIPKIAAFRQWIMHEAGVAPTTQFCHGNTVGPQWAASRPSLRSV